ncbi:RNA polymerase II mediator complex subunit MED8 [Aspergillus chevalieri]|uniref:Mediator of RNA polymerase II transcription subunit 8 n=1 Tax=Aspergillus chevalieri TaxID=182096 RepID=A0A7R7VG61_ASPCH|nr:mediator of RNA polymerase II transcription subunit 8 [Aspergillus chevalieri]BCR84014.1 mediator of RNA polymerase II transcription subunit 8 [Aspergillus chevalieri]
MTSLNQDQIKALEQSRQRLVQLTHSLSSLITSINTSDPLPSWSSLQSQATIISNNLITVSEHLTDQKDLFNSLVAYPGPDYPSRTQGPALEQLLRTKLDPRVEDWVSRGRTTGQKSRSQTQVGGRELSEGDLAELWAWAPVEANQEARRRNWGGNFTLEEKEAGIENVVTGLRRELEDEDESEEEEEEEEDQMDIVGARKKASGGGLEFDIAARQPSQVAAAAGPMMPLDDVLRFMTTGLPPKQR